MKGRYAQLITAVVLFVAVLGAGYLVLNQNNLLMLKFPKSNFQEEVSTNNYNVLNFPSNNDPQEEKDKHLALVNRLAKEATTIYINSECQPDPLVVKVKKGVPLTVTNTTEKDHTVFINPQNRYEIESGKSAKINTNFEEGVGVYGYLCDDSQRPKGIILTVP